LIVATGLETVVCVRIAEGAHKPVEQSDVTVLTGGALAHIGAIKAADIAYDAETNKQLLFAGGSKGLAVITNTQKNDWRKLPSSLIGDYKYVRKIVCDRNHAYILTDTTLDRIDIRALHAGAITLARKTDFAAEHATLNDLLVSNGYAILATHKGLFTTGFLVDSATARSSKDMHWTPVSVPGKVQAVYRLSTATVTGRDQDLTSGAGGMVYTLSGKMSEQSSFFCRFTIQNTDAGITLVPLKDKIANNKLYPFLTFDTFKQFCVTDGAYFVHGVNKESSKLPTLSVGKHRSSPKIPLDFSDASRMTCALRSALLGSWLVAGDFGIKVNE
jgi:hypothetical protein